MRIPVTFLLLIFVLGEIAAFILVGKAVGVIATLALVMLAGITLLRRQGISTLNRMRADLAAGRAATGPLAQGALMAVAGVLLIIPGFLTDVAGLLLCLPVVRRGLGRAISRRVQVGIQRRGTLRPSPAGVLELDRSEFSSAARRATPWRPPDIPSPPG